MFPIEAVARPASRIARGWYAPASVPSSNCTASMKHSFEAGRAIETDSAATIADGIAVRVPVPYALDTMKATVDEVIAVSDEAILAAMRMAHEIFGLVVEPAGAAGLAAILHHPARFAGLDVATIFCGGNLTPGQIRDWLQPA